MPKSGWGNNYRKVSRRLKELRSKQIAVGIVKPTTHKGENGKTQSTAAIYFWNDQGTKKIPKRETLKPAIEKMDFKPPVKIMFQAVVKGNYNTKLEGIGKVMVNSVKKEIHSISSPALSPFTLARRKNGGSNPLIDTKQLVNSISYKVS